MSGRLRGGALTALSRIVTQLAQLATFMVAAASMGPEDFGLYALVSAAVVILSALSGSGWPEYAMQWHGEAAQQRRVFALALISGAAMSALVFGLALLAPLLTSLPEARPLMELLAVTVVLHSTTNVLNGVLIWQHRLSTSAICILVSETFGMLISVYLLIQGHGVFALAWGKIGGSLLWLALGLAATRLVPDFRLPRADWLEISRFATNIMSVRMLITLRAYSGTILVGLFLGAAEAGIFRAAQRLAGALSEVIGEPTKVLAWSLFRETRDSKDGVDGFQSRANLMFPMVLALSLPLFSTLALAGEDLVVGLLGDDWRGAGPVLMALAVTGMIFSFGSTVEPLLSLAGAVRQMPRMVFANFLLGTILTLAAGPFGLLAMAWAQAIAALLIVLWNSRILRDRAKVKLGEVLWVARWQAPALIASVIATELIFRGFVSSGLHPLIQVLLFGAINASLFWFALAMVDAALFASIKRAVIRHH